MRPRRYWYLIASIVVCTVAVAVSGVIYTRYEIRQANMEWCDLLVTLDNPIPPQSTNPRAVDAAMKLHNLRVKFGC